MSRRPKSRVFRDESKIDGGDKINITINEQVVEQVNQLSYLRSLIKFNGACAAEIKIRISIANNEFSKRRKMFQSFQKL